MCAYHLLPTSAISYSHLPLRGDLVVTRRLGHQKFRGEICRKLPSESWTPPSQGPSLHRLGRPRSRASAWSCAERREVLPLPYRTPEGEDRRADDRQARRAHARRGARQGRGNAAGCLRRRRPAEGKARAPRGRRPSPTCSTPTSPPRHFTARPTRPRASPTGAHRAPPEAAARPPPRRHADARETSSGPSTPSATARPRIRERWATGRSPASGAAKARHASRSACCAASFAWAVRERLVKRNPAAGVKTGSGRRARHDPR